MNISDLVVIDASELEDVISQTADGGICIAGRGLIVTVPEEAAAPTD